MKKTLLIAAAALAASVISSQAQVYSQNIVGYANVPTPQSGKSYLITVPFKVGATNGANEVFPTLPDFSSLLIWTGNGYHTYVYDSTDPSGFGTSVTWYEGDDSTPATIPTLPVGQGFFLIPAAGNLTNTFVGAVAVNVGSSNNLALPLPGHSYLVSSVVPYAGAVTNGTSSTGGANLNNLPDFSSLLFWNGNGYTTVVYDSTDPSGFGTGVKWYQGDDATPYVDPTSGGNSPTLTVGQGFFLIPASSYTWTTGL